MVLGVLLTAHVQCYGHGLIANFAGHFLCVAFVDIRNNYMRTFSRKRLADRCTNTTPTAGHDHYFTVKLHQQVNPFVIAPGQERIV